MPSFSSRSAQLKVMTPQLIAEVTLYPTAFGGRNCAVQRGWGCARCLSRDSPIVGYDGWPLLGDAPLAPGESRQLGWVFVSGEETVGLFRKSGVFYLS
jgi:hypothetical protein